MDKIYFIIFSLSGGAGKVAVELGNFFTSRGIKVELVCAHYEDKLRKKSWFSILVFNSYSLFSFSYRIMKSFGGCESGVWIISSSSLASILTIPLKLKGNKKIILRETTATEEVLKTKNFAKRLFLKLMIWLSSLFTSGIIVNSEETGTSLKQYISRSTYKKIFRIYNPAYEEKNLTEIEAKNAPFENSSHNADKIWRIIAVGRLVYQKGFDILLRSALIIKKQKVIFFKLTIIGDGPEKCKLLKLIEEYNLEDIVEILGYSDDPYRFIRNSDLFVLSSRYEGFGNVLVEALASGLRIVSTDCIAGPKEILNTGYYGRLVAVNDAQALACGIIDEIRNETCSSDQRIERAKDFDKAIICQEYLNYIEKIYHNAVN
jgi:glycosyltransferase involved in cell wall biosynthesis